MLTPRDPSALAVTEFDLIVVGGGVYGIMVALEATRRGLCPLLIERADFGGATSHNSLRIVHGGLRYLEHREFGLVRKSLAERRVLTKIAPHRRSAPRGGVPRPPDQERVCLRTGSWCCG